MPDSRRPRAGTGPRGLSKDAIVEAAVALMEEVGEEGFTLRKLGDRVGCDPMAVLYHFKSKQGLHRAMAEWLTARLAPVEADAPWDARLRGLADRHRELALAYPATFGLMPRFLNTGLSDYRHTETVFRALEDAGIGEADIPAVCLGWYASVIGLAMGEVGGLLQPATAEELAEIERLPEDAFALTRRFAGFYRDLEAGRVHARTVDLLIDGIRRQAETARAGART